jgi:cell wall-associated NlpC family hydrolase
MPRVTRAAVRIMEDEATVAAGVPLPSTPNVERAPLGEITGNHNEQPKVTLEVNLSKPTKKPHKARKAKPTKKTKKENKSGPESTCEVLEDDNESATSSAVEEACKELKKPYSGGQTDDHCFQCV